jgi:cytochrome c biogenesis factor
LNDTVAALGELSLWLAFIFTAWSAVAAAAAVRGAARPLMQSAARGITASAALVAAALAALWILMVRQDFSFLIVAATTHRDLPVFYRFSALWSGQRGGVVLWTLVMSLAAALAIRQPAAAPGIRERLRIALLAACTAALAGAAAVYSRPFSRMEYPLAEGLGMPAELQHVGVALEPVLLSAGMAALIVATILSLGEWGRPAGAKPAVRGPDPLPWFAATLTAICAGLLLEAWSTYHELGWGEYSRRTIVGSLVAVPMMIAAFGLWSSLRSRTELRRRLLREAAVPLAAGAALILAGSVAFQFRQDAGFVMSGGQTEQFKDSFGSVWRITSLGISNDRHASENIQSLGLEAGAPDGSTRIMRTDRVSRMSARGEEIGDPLTIAAIEMGARGDLIVAVDDVFENRALLRVRYVPLSILVWIGALLILAGLLAVVLRTIRHQGET